MMKCLLKIFLFVLLPVFSRAQVNPLFIEPTKKQADSLELVLKQTTNDTIRMESLRELALYYLDFNADSSYYFIEKELPLVERLKLKLWEADALDLYGIASNNLGNYTEALKALNKSVEIAENKDSEKGIWDIGKFSSINDPFIARQNMLATIYTDLAGLYFATGNFDKEAIYVRKSISTATPVNNFTVLSLAYRGLAVVSQNKGNIDSALIYFHQSLVYQDKSGYKKYEGSTLTAIGNIYLNRKNFVAAYKYFSEAVISSKKLNNKAGLAQTYGSLSNLYMSTGKLDSGYYYARASQTIILEVGRPSGILDSYFTLSKFFNLDKKPDSAYKYLHLAMILNDSLNNADKVKQFQNIGFDQQLKLDELEKEKIETQNKIRTYTMLAGIAVFMLIAFLLYRNNRNRKKANELLLNKNIEIEQQKKNVEETLTELKSTQAQLIQSEKMASLGELTAGIAHEIQNPLNFVNNFSDVNKELLEELKEEAGKGNIDEVIAIADDVIGNEEKINHHGKRADAIVKGMLQHSRSSSGVKEPTDINALADEYLRLAYHGLRAKDKSFNATIKTDFDETIGNIKIVPQDIGRVILNLITNAFYVVDEKKNQGLKGYEPTVTVKTLKNPPSDGRGAEVLICVKDNGNGIPQKVLDKIFQPFFTTKPTGQGTGLGLSLSYDIVKAHGGEIKVETKQDEARPDDPVGRGTEFIIQLPI